MDVAPGWIEQQVDVGIGGVIAAGAGADFQQCGVAIRPIDEMMAVAIIFGKSSTIAGLEDFLALRLFRAGASADGDASFPALSREK